MRRFQKVFYALAAVVLLGWMGASTASATVGGTQFLASPSQTRPVRSEGLAEAVGSVILSAQSGGFLQVDSTITLDYGAALEATSGTVSTTCTPNVAGVSTSVQKTISGNALTIKIITAELACTTGQSISITGVRVNANAIGAGNNVSVTISSSVPSAVAGTNPISIIQFVALVVATVQAAPSSKLSGTAKILLLCDSSTVLGTGVKVKFSVTENFNQAFLSRKDEQGLNDNTFVQPFVVKFAFTGIPVGVQLAVASLASSNSSETALNTLGTLAATGLPFTSKAGQQDVDVTVEIDTLNVGTNTTGEVDKMVLEILFNVPDKALLTSTDATGALKVSLVGGTSAPQVPRFVSNTQGSGDAIKALSCATYLLYSWIAFVPGDLDTGMTVSNTSADPAIIGTKKQSGTATLYLWPSDGSASSSVALKDSKGDAAIDAGETATFVASSLGKAFTGYGIVVCTFQYGHGIAAFLSLKTGFFGASYEAISLTNPRFNAAGINVSSEIQGH